MDPVRPDLAPDPDDPREAMERQQREVARTAVFADDLGFDPDRVTVEASTTGEGPEASETTRTTGLTLAEAAESAAADDPGDGAADGPPSDDRPLVAGVDQAFLDGRAVSAVVVSRGAEVVERAHAVTDLAVPYVPGLLSFREGGPILAAFEALETTPDLAVFDGNGRIHFRQAGLATHMGVVLDLPSVGVAKNLLCGTPLEPTDERPAGWRTPIVADDDVEPRPGQEEESAADAADAADGTNADAAERTVIGYAYQSRQYDSRPVVNPVYVSPGHRVSAATAVDLVERLCAGYKLPEPTRLADAYADEVKGEVQGNDAGGSG